MSLFCNNLFNNNNNIFNFNNNKKIRSIGLHFKGLELQEKNQNVIFFVITSSPEFSDLSLEELRYNDIMHIKTGLSPSQHNINKKENNLFFGQSNDNSDRKIFQANNYIKDKDIFKTITENGLFNFNEKIIEEERNYNNMDNKMIKKSSIFDFNNINNNFNNKNYNFDLNKNNDYKNNNNNSNSLTVNMDKSKSNKVNIEINDDNNINIIINNKINIDINDNSLSINTKNININRNYSSLVINTNNNFNNDIQKNNLLNSSQNNEEINKNENNLFNIFDNNNYNNNKKVSNIFDLINKNETIQKEDSNLLDNSFYEKEEKKDENNEIINYFPENKTNKSMDNKINISQSLSQKYMNLDNQNISNLENTFSKNYYFLLIKFSMFIY